MKNKNCYVGMAKTSLPVPFLTSLTKKELCAHKFFHFSSFIFHLFRTFAGDLKNKDNNSLKQLVIWQS